MSSRAMFRGMFGTLIAALLTVSGCEVLHNAGVPGLSQYVKKDPVIVEKERSCREQFALHRDHKSFYWLLKNRVSNGMTLHEVEQAIGEPGEFTDEFKGVPFDGIVQTTDPAYRWGPDSSGRSVILFFRDGHVSNFSPKDYATP